MRILFISHSPGLGGAESALLELVHALRSRHTDCRVLVPKPGPLLDALKSLHIPGYVEPYGHWTSKGLTRFLVPWRLLLTPFWTACIRKHIQSYNPDVVITNTIMVAAGALAAKSMGIPHIWHLHEFGREDHGFQFDIGEAAAFAVMRKLSTHAVANSHAVAKKFAPAFPATAIPVVRQSVSSMSGARQPLAEVVVPARNAASRLVLVGAIHTAKRQEDAVRALAAVRRRGLDVELMLVGSGHHSHVERLKETVTEHGLGNYVRFTGQVSDPRPYVASGDILLMCSRCEAFGRVTVEGMREGKPVVASRSGGSVELIRDGFNGLTYEPLNHDDLASKIEILVQNPELAQAMGRRGKEWAASSFSEERYAREVLDVLHHVVASKGGAG